ncbi:MAG: RHS repeat protein, partial [Caldilineaceae bacterium]|nr:RHS repeat protein [Caldilineaceae bacterium]
TAYDATYGYVSTVTNPLTHATSYVVDPGRGVQTKIIDPNNKITELQYDSFGRLQKVWLPSEPKSGVASLEFVYDAAARPAWVKSRTLQIKGSSTYLDSWSYVDGFGRAIQSQSAAITAGQRIVGSQKYNSIGQLAYQSAPYQLLGAAGSGYSAPSWSSVANYHYLQYEELGNVWLDETKSTTSVLWSNMSIYDAWQTRVYDPQGNRTDYDRDGFGNLAKVTEYTSSTMSFATTYAYDWQQNLTSVTDAAGNVTTMTYDLLGRKLTMSDPDMGSWQYQYDGNGNLTGQRDGRSLWLYMAYDDLNRLVSKRKDNATTGTLIADYVYDATGQKGLLSKSRAYDAAGTTEVQSVTYDARNRVIQQQWVVPGTGGGTFRMDYALNEADQRTSLTYPGGTAGQQGEVVSYSYNAIGQLTGVSGSGVSYLASATYNAQGQPTQMVNDSGANGLTRKWSYETNSLRLSVLQAGKNAAFDDRQKLTYAYDNNGNVTSQLNTLNSNQRQCFEYDWLNRLTKAYTTGNATCGTYTATGTGPYNHTYAYNNIGNPTSYAGSAYNYGDTNHRHAVP